MYSFYSYEKWFLNFCRSKNEFSFPISNILEEKKWNRHVIIIKYLKKNTFWGGNEKR